MLFKNTSTTSRNRNVLIPLIVLYGLIGMLLWLNDITIPFSSLQQQQHGGPAAPDNNQEELRAELQTLRVRLNEAEKAQQDLQEQLTKAETQTQDLQSKLLDQCQQQQQSSGESKSASEQQQEPLYQSKVCQSLMMSSSQSTTSSDSTTPSGSIPSAAHLWTQWIGKIHQATHMLPNDPKFVFHDFTAHLLQVISSQLPRTVQTLPRHWESVNAIIDVGWKRYQYLKDHPDHSEQEDNNNNNNNDDDDEIPRPIQIVVLGGSLLQGTNCRKMLRDLNMPQVFLPLRECSWGFRLGKFLNAFFQMPLVQVTSLAVGGTNSETGTLLLHYDMLPPEASSPDVIINAYSTNDMHVWTMEQASLSNATLGDQVRTIVQEFVRNATRFRHQKTCRQSSTSPQDDTPVVAPLVLRFEDYIGNEQREILDTMDGASSVHLLAQYYGFGSMSYTELVREWVYGDTHETWFSPEGWYDPKDPDDKMVREIHPQLPMHMVAAWIVSYNFLNIVTNYCSIEPWRQIVDPSQKTVVSHQDDILQVPYETSRLAIPQLPVLRGDTQYIPNGKPKSPPKGLLPRLTPTLALDDISEAWRTEAKDMMEFEQQQPICSTEDALSLLKCPFAWMSKIKVVPLPDVEETRKGSDQGTATAYLKAHALGDFGLADSAWKIQSDHGKYGIVPEESEIGAELTFEVPHRPVPSSDPPLRTVTVFYMKSYGPAWAASTAKVEVLSAGDDSSSNDWTVIQSQEFLGYHSKNTSETYSDTIYMPQKVELRKMRIRISLVAGSTFKIMGLLACR